MNALSRKTFRLKNLTSRLEIEIVTTYGMVVEGGCEAGAVVL